MFEKTIRVFLSSTFKDMQDERNTLHRETFARLRAYCEASGFQFHVIDLRWGVNDEAAWDQRTEAICLNEIRRCRLVTPRPNFVALIGQRYGWRPLPMELSAADWETIRGEAGERRFLLDAWYFEDRNNVPLVYRLRRRATAQERDAVWWRTTVEDPLREVMLSSARQVLPDVPCALDDVDLSLTEKEIRSGTENAAQANWQAFVYFRRLDVPQDVLREPFIDLNEAGTLADPRSSEKLRALHTRLEQNRAVTTRDHTARLVGGRVDPQYLARLQKSVYSDLKEAIDSQIADFEATPPAAREIEAHEAFGAERRRNYVARAVEARVHEYLDRDDRRPLVLHGVSGGGKTALIAKLAADLAARRPRCIDVVRFIGATGDSTGLRSLVRSIHAQIAAESRSVDASESMKGDPQASLRTTLTMGTGDRPVVVLLDALDQLSPDDRALSGDWIPRELPANCRLVATCMTEGALDDEGSGVFDALAGRLDPESMLSIEEPDLPDLQQMLTAWLRSYCRQLSGPQREAVEGALVACPRPLFLRVLVEIARHWREDTTAGSLPTSIPTVIDRFLDGMEAHHGRALVGATLGLLAASRSGLTEVEIVELLGERTDVIEEFRTGSRYDYADAIDRLPPVVWSRLFYDLGLFLGDSTIAGVSVLGFYHRQLQTVARHRFLEPRTAEFRRDLASHFRRSPAWYTDGGRAPNPRRCYELPYQLRSLAQYDTLVAVMTDRDHVDAKIGSGLADDLLRDFVAMDGVEGAFAEPLVSFFARQYLDGDSVLAATFRAGDLHSFFAYRERTSFYRLLLESLVGDLSRGSLGGPAEARARSIRSRARVDLGGMLRRSRSFDEARKMLVVVDDLDSGLDNSDLGVGWYEIGYVEYMEDEYPEAARALRRSVQLAETGGDRVGAAISEGVELWAAYKCAPDRAGLECLVAASERALEMFTEKQNSDRRALRWVMNSLLHIVDASFLLGDVARLESHLRDLRANAWIREFGARDSLLQYEARFAMATERFEKAVSYWERFLQVTPIKEDTESGAWPLLDYGVSLVRVGKIDLARRTLDRALELRPRGACNAFWQERAREERARLSG